VELIQAANEESTTVPTDLFNLWALIGAGAELKTRIFVAGTEVGAVITIENRRIKYQLHSQGAGGGDVRRQQVEIVALKQTLSTGYSGVRATVVLPLPIRPVAEVLAELNKCSRQL
jgi:hypothetical protein